MVWNEELKRSYRGWEGEKIRKFETVLVELH
jgi:hypothetical protein